MKLRILLVNPWIYDFAAYNLWARPLGLFKVAEYLSQFDVELHLIDCLAESQSRKYGTGHYRSDEVPRPQILNSVRRKFKRYGMHPADFRALVRKSGPLDFVIMTSMMAYWYPGIQEAISIIREERGDIPVILGGIYATLYHEHASAHSGADFIYSGPLNDALKFAISTFGFRMKNKYAPRPYYEIFRNLNAGFAPLLTSTGCPFRCSYCASRLLADFKQTNPDSVFREIIKLHENGISDFAFYDDALLFNSDAHLKPILRSVINAGIDVRFHTPNGLHARFVDRELAGLMKKAGFSTLRLSLETIDEERQKTSGAKVCNEDLEKALSALWDAGFTKSETGVYIMYGLPGQESQEVIESVVFLKKLGVRINLTEFAPIKGTRSWDELLQLGIITDDLDPLLTNNTVFSSLFSKYDPAELDRMKLDVKEYNAG